MTRQGEVLLVGVGIAAVGAAVLAADHKSVPYADSFTAAASESGVPSALLKAIGRHETGFRPLVGPVNANGTHDIGIMQINSATATALKWDPARLLSDADYNIRCAAQLLVQLQRELGTQGDTARVVAAYNAGSPAIKRRGIFNTAYVADVLFHYTLFRLAEFLFGAGATPTGSRGAGGSGSW